MAIQQKHYLYRDIKFILKKGCQRKSRKQKVEKKKYDKYDKYDKHDKCEVTLNSNVVKNYV